MATDVDFNIPFNFKKCAKVNLTKKIINEIHHSAYMLDGEIVKENEARVLGIIIDKKITLVPLYIEQILKKVEGLRVTTF